ncbi:short-chain dehydrogenase [Pseudoalteromonas luteoviolacea]|uniref:Short-chain dehydrogenase n=1 Tax=Pseudoalteromonas luteoviolacea TaxID=43657 RepID=A0A1C0TUU3_9GAMM|nr:SDR family NAD(P)-dependent oxidoreductase [Pseudoalteromonas luteoviolacea]OCQ23072.1 short-chain dehydrogenase [Pseudoalteromonas luteoviolacea]
MNLVNKVIVITGGTSGIGRQLVSLLCDDNTIIVVARPSERLTKLEKAHQNIHVFSADLSESTLYKGLAQKIQQMFPVIDVLINNAAIQNTPTFTETHFNYDTIEREINVNLNAICSLSYLLLPNLMSAIENAIILNINSGLSLVPKKSSAIYCACKAAMNAFSQSLNYQLEHTNVKVLQAFLPLVDTPMTSGRESTKLTSKQAAIEIIKGLEKQSTINDIGKVKLLRILIALSPSLAKKLLKRS